VTALLLSPIATELPEIMNAIIWVRQGKTELAAANISGAMMIQAAVPSGLGVLFTPWLFDVPLKLAAGATIASITYLIWLFRTGRVTPARLAVAAGFYLAFAIGSNVLISNNPEMVLRLERWAAPIALFFAKRMDDPPPAPTMADRTGGRFSAVPADRSDRPWSAVEGHLLIGTPVVLFGAIAVWSVALVLLIGLVVSSVSSCRPRASPGSPRRSSCLRPLPPGPRSWSSPGGASRADRPVCAVRIPPAGPFCASEGPCGLVRCAAPATWAAPPPKARHTLPGDDSARPLGQAGRYGLTTWSLRWG